MKRTSIHRPRTQKKSTAPEGMVRLQRVMADAGVAARRVCEQMIEAGDVEVNGSIVRQLPIFVDPTKDRITVRGRELPRAKPPRDGKPASPGLARKFYIMVNKPSKVLTVPDDLGGRATVLDLVKHPANPRLVPVGRLDYESRGLVLLTNDGTLVNALTHPRFGVPRVFEIVVKGDMPPDFLIDLQRGLNMKARRAAEEKGKRAAGDITLEFLGRKAGSGESHAKTLLRATVAPGMAAKLDDLLAQAGVKPTSITQVALGALKLIDCRPGEWRELERHEINALRKTIREE